MLQTWWTANNLTFDLPVPPEAGGPGAIPPVTLPANDVPDGGSEVAGATESPTGALTLRYEFPSGSTLGALVLTTAADVPPAPATELIACPLTGDGDFETHPGGGPITELPESDCAESVTAGFDEEAGVFRFDDVAALADDDHLAVAVLPVAGRAVLERALSDSLSVDVPENAGPVAPPPPTTAPTTLPAPPPTFLGQVAIPPATPPPAVAAPTAPDQPASEPREIVERLITVYRGSGAGQAAGSAVAGGALLFLAVSGVWRRGRRELLTLVDGT